MIVLAWLAVALFAAAVSLGVGRVVAPRAPRMAAGAAFVLGCTLAALPLRVIAIAHTTPFTLAAANAAGVFAYVAAGFGALGLFLDGADTADARGPFGAVVALSAVSLAYLALSTETETEWAVVAVPMMAGIANLFRLAPHRARVPLFVIAAIATLVGADALGPALSIGVGAAVALVALPAPASVRTAAAGLAMGAFIGWAVVERGTHTAWLAALIAVAVAHAAVLVVRRRR